MSSAHPVLAAFLGLGVGACLVAAGAVAPPISLSAPLARAGEADPSAPTRAPSATPTATATPTRDVEGRTEDDRPRRRRQWDHVAGNPGAACRAALTASGAKFRALPDQPEPDRKGCGVPHGVLLSRGPTGIAYSPPVHADCSLALHLLEIEEVIQAEAEAHLGTRIQKIGTLGSYACRSVKGRLAGWSDGLSEHSFGNAVDLARFDPKRGRSISVARSYPLAGAEAVTPEARFLRAIARGLRREAGVRVLGPDFDASHRDHLHLDRGTPRWW